MNNAEIQARIDAKKATIKLLLKEVEELEKQRKYVRSNGWDVT